MSNTTEPAALAEIEPIYQVWNTSDYPSHWADTDKILYDVCAKDDRRIVYSAATVERLVQERDKYKDSVEHYGDLYAKLAAMTQERETLSVALEYEAAQLAASQAREQQMREMWQKVEAEYFSRLKEQDDLTANFEAEKEMYGWNFHKGLRGGLVEFHIYMTKIAKALSLPQDDTALRQWGAKLLREMAQEMENSRCEDYEISILRRKADELEAVEDEVERARRLLPSQRNRRFATRTS